MTPFNELYSKYYALVTHILQLAHEKEITLEELRNYINKEGFLETPTSLLPALTSQDEEGYHLLLKEDANKKGAASYTSILKNAPIPPITELEASWLKSLLTDPKLCLFLEEKDIYLLKKALSGVLPLYTDEMIGYARQNTNNSIYQDPEYQNLFKQLTMAIRENRLITFNDSLKDFAPYKLEYMIREDSFSLLAIRLENHTPVSLERIALTDLKHVEFVSPAPPRDVLEDFARTCKCQEPIVFELNNMRSGFERAFMYLSPYERITQFNEENNTCLVNLYYYPFDEAALIDMLMSFGPIIKILKPTHIRKCFKDRINAQVQLFFNH